MFDEALPVLSTGLIADASTRRSSSNVLTSKMVETTAFWASRAGIVTGFEGDPDSEREDPSTRRAAGGTSDSYRE